jgi:hypothetical protein
MGLVIARDLRSSIGLEFRAEGAEAGCYITRVIVC